MKTMKILAVLMITEMMLFNPLETQNKESKEGWSIPETDCFTGTVYHAVEEQTDSTPLITADGSKIDKDNLNSQGCSDIERLRGQKDKWMAVSRDLLEKYEYGSEVNVFIEGEYVGKFTIHDTMNQRFTGRVDFLTNTKVYNKWENVRVIKTGKRQRLA